MNSEPITEEEIRLLTRLWVRLQDAADAYSDGMGSALTQEEATAARVMLELAKRAREAARCEPIGTMRAPGRVDELVAIIRRRMWADRDGLDQHDGILALDELAKLAKRDEAAR